MSEHLTLDWQSAPSICPPSLFVIILNWNGWRSTLPCIESVLGSNYARLKVIVCDNGSTDDSLSAMRSWADGQLAAPRPQHQKLANLIPDTRQRTLRTVFVAEDECFENANHAEADVVFLCRKTNGGYAAGNNAGLLLALQLGADYVWILNNDTLVEPSAAQYLIDHMRSADCVGLCGTTIRSYNDPDRIHLLAGWHFNKWTARPTPVLSLSEDLKELSYVDGSSVCVSREFLQAVGLLSLEYFLYCEELDWATRAQGRFELGYCKRAVVYHKGADNQPAELRSFREYYGMRARVLVTKKFWPIFLFTVLPSMLRV